MFVCYPIGLEDAPCIVVAIYCALHYGFNKQEVKVSVPVNKEGYCTLATMNKTIRQYFKVSKYLYFKRKERMTLEQEDKWFGAFKDSKAIVCVEGHYIFVNGTDYHYYSYFNNDNDKVVAIWFLEDDL